MQNNNENKNIVDFNIYLNHKVFKNIFLDNVLGPESTHIKTNVKIRPSF